MKQHIALIGFMAAGKSTLGRRVARRLGCPFYDIDHEVSSRHGSIVSVFDREGEEVFRTYEFEALERVLDNDPGIVALGGGTVLFEPSAKLLKKRAYRIFIKVAPEQILRRVRRSNVVRPLLGPTPSLQRIRELYASRMPSYAHNDLVIEADAMTPAQIVEHIIAWTHRKNLPFS